MLYADDTHRRDDPTPPEPEPWRLSDGVVWIYRTIVRYHRMVAGIAAALVLLALAYVLLRSPAYMAVTQVQISNLRLTSSRDDSFFAEVQMEPRFVDTQLQILRSERVGYAVVDALNLTQRLEKASTSWLSRWGWAQTPSTAGTTDVARKAALKLVQLGLHVQQVGLSEIVEIRFTSDDREFSALTANAILQAYLADQEQSRLEAAQTGSSWLRERLREVGPRSRALTLASTPKDSINTRGLLILALAAGAGLAVGGMAALARDLLDRSIRTPEQLSDGLAGEFLGVLPRATGGGGHRLDPAMAAATERNTLRQIRAVWEAGLQRDTRTLGVVSTCRREGRSHVAGELARSIATMNRRVLLIDADPTGGQLHDRSDSGPGLTEWCNHLASDVNELIKPGDIEGLSILPAGAGGEVDWGNRVEDLLQSLHSQFDYIIVDLPPLAMPADARGSAAVLDDYLMVVGWGAVHHQNLKVALTKLAPVRNKLIGFVLNDVDLGEAGWLPSAEFDFLLQTGRASSGGSHGHLPRPASRTPSSGSPLHPLQRNRHGGGRPSAAVSRDVV